MWDQSTPSPNLSDAQWDHFCGWLPQASFNTWWKTGCSLPIMISIWHLLDTLSNGTLRRRGHLSFSSDQRIAGVSPAMLSMAWACKRLEDLTSRFVTVSSTLRERVLTSVPPVPTIVRFSSCPYNWNSSAASSGMKELVEHGFGMTFALSSLFLLLIIAGRIIHDTCSTWLVLYVCSRGLRLTGVGSRVLAPVARSDLGSGFGCSSGRKGEAFAFSWSCDRSVKWWGVLSRR